MGARLRGAGFGSAHAFKVFMDEGPERVLDAIFPEEAVHAVDLAGASARFSSRVDKAADREGRARGVVSRKRLGDA
eukprot:5633830-Pyramimonas_sp.AAC.1